MVSILCWPTVPEHMACPDLWLVHSFTLLKKLIFPLPEAINCKELLDEGCDFVPTSLFLCCDFVRFEFVQVLCMLSQSQWVLLGFSPSVSEKCYFSGVTNLCWLLIFLWPLSHKDLRALNGRALMKTAHLPLSLSLSSCFQLWVSVLTTIYCKKKLVWWGFSDALIHGYRNMYLVVVSLLCSLCRRIVVGFPVWPISHDLSSVRLLAH